jgi:DNA-binding MarR family transcriptional regulator
MVAQASKLRAAPLYEVGTFRSHESVGALVGRARKAMYEEFERELAPLGLTAAQALVLVILADDPEATAAAMCRTLSHDAGAMTRIVDKLEKRGLVRRVREARDRRSSRLQLTREGAGLHAEVRRVQVAMLNRMLRGFSRADARTLETLLRRILENAQ